MNGSREEQLDRLLDERDLRQLSYDFCRGVDRGDTDLLNQLYHEDGLDEHGFNKTNTARELIDALPANRLALEEAQHNITTSAYDIDGDKAEGIVYVVAYHRLTVNDEEGPIVLVIGARYLDKYERRDGVWKISHRRVVEDWSLKVPAPGTRGNELVEDLPRGEIGADDPAYSFFASHLREGVRA